MLVQTDKYVALETVKLECHLIGEQINSKKDPQRGTETLNVEHEKHNQEGLSS